MVVKTTRTSETNVFLYQMSKGSKKDTEGVKVVTQYFILD